MEKITIVISSYNQGKFIPDLIESLKKQTFQNFKILVVDSYSTDNTINQLKEYDKVEIINLKCSAEAGYLHAINLVKSKYLMVMTTSDYYYSSTWLQRAFEALEEDTELSLVWSSAISINEEKRFKGIWRPELLFTSAPKKFNYIYYWFLDFYLPELNYCVHTEVYQDCIKDYDKKFKYKLSFLWLFLINFTKNGFLQKYIRQIGCVGRGHEDSQGEKNENDLVHKNWDLNIKKLQSEYLKDLFLGKKIHHFRDSQFKIIKSLSRTEAFFLYFKVNLKRITMLKYYLIRVILFKVYVKRLVKLNKFPII